MLDPHLTILYTYLFRLTLHTVLPTQASLNKRKAEEEWQLGKDDMHKLFSSLAWRDLQDLKAHASEF